MSRWSLAEIEAQNRAALLVVAPVTAPATASPVAQAAAPTRPAPPQRFLPDLRPLVPKDVYTVGSRAGGDLRLKFDTTIWNAGRGPLETRGAKNPATGQLEVYQYVYQGEQAVRGRAVGTFDYSQRHGHLHFDDFAHYQLWSLDAQGKRKKQVADNAKVGFCLMDIKDIGTDKTHLESGSIGKPGGPVYAGCREDVQGVSVGWGDEYLALLYEQDLELTNVPDGRYALVVTTNPERRLEELDYRNNTASVGVVIENGVVTALLEREPRA